MEQKNAKKQITKIVLTGGPCAGKTTAMSWVQNYFTKMGYRVLFVPETATELICGGISAATLQDGLKFQLCQIPLQMKKEEIFTYAAQQFPEDKILIVCDRGCLDGKAFMSEEEFQQMLKILHTDEITLRDSYDAVFHLVTAAKGAVEAYTLSNNAARSETPEQAAAVDDRLIAAWTGHPHFRVIANEGEFKDKMQRALAEITAFLGEPVPFEIERKYLVKMPDLTALEAMPTCQKVDICQTYITCQPDREVRVRQRGQNGNYIFTRTEKSSISPIKRVEREERLDQSEYLHLLMEADPTMHPIRKTRYCISANNQYFELDIYPAWKDYAILEVELRSEDEVVKMPDYFQVVKEVTGDVRYNNSTLAKTGGAFPE